MAKSVILMRGLLPTVILLVGAACGATAADETQLVSMKLVSARLPADWRVQSDGGGFTARPEKGEKSEVISIGECIASGAECLSTCDETSARNYLYFLESNRPPALRQQINRTDGLFEYRASGRYGNSDLYVAAVVLCGTSGLIVAMSQSVSQERAISYVQSFSKSIEWRK